MKLYYLKFSIFYGGIKINDEVFSKDLFGAMLFLLNKNHHTYLNDHFNEYGINLIQGLIILKLSDFPDTTQKELGEYLNLSKGSVAKYLANLEENGFIVREKMQDNQRMYKLSLQEKAFDLVPKLQKISKDWENQTGLDSFNPEFLSDFKKLVANSKFVLENENDGV